MTEVKTPEKVKEIKEMKLKNVTKYDVVISEVPGGIEIKSGAIVSVELDVYTKIIGRYAKFLVPVTGV
jgi:hypothetical protein